VINYFVQAVRAQELHREQIVRLRATGLEVLELTDTDAVVLAR
jgi:hypothetical protein